MELTESQYQRIADCLPRQRGNVSLTNLRLLNALLHVAEQDCKWPTIYTRMNRWSKSGVLERIFIRLQQGQMLLVSLCSFSD